VHSLNNQNQELTESDQFQQIEKDIAIQMEHIAMLQAVAREDTKSGYRERARAVLSQIKDEQSNLQVLYTKKNTLKSQPEPRVTLILGKQGQQEVIMALMGGLLELVTG